MSTESPPPAPARRNVRLGCLLQVGARSTPAHTASLLPDLIHTRVEEAALWAGPPAVGSHVGFRLLIPDEDDPIQGQAEVSWVNPEERDAAGVTAVGLGLKVLPTSRSALERLEAFLQKFRYTLLAVDRERAALRVLGQTLEAAGHRVLTCTGSAEAFSLLEEFDVAVVIAGETLAEGTCQEFLQALDRRFPSSPLVRIVSLSKEFADVIQDQAALGRIFHFLIKPFRLSEVEQAVRQGIDAFALSVENERLRAELKRVNQQLLRENLYLRRRVQVYSGFDNLVGQSDNLRSALNELEQVRSTEASVHVHGETGTGKELVARALHFGGPRARGPFVAHNCAGLSESLLQSTLFGHRKGSFTGADRDHPGVFEQANGGTLFLDEVAELSPLLQVSLLRALDGEITPVGSTQTIRVDVRIISATHEDLRERVALGFFREDLYFRLVVLSVRLPPLRERKGDVLLLCRHFLALHCQHLGRPVPELEPKALAALEHYPWPGNIRELENEIERLLVLAEPGCPLQEALLSEHIRGAEDRTSVAAKTEDVFWLPEDLGYDEAIKRFERHLLVRALGRTGGSLRAAADSLGVERSRLGKLRIRLGLPREGETR